MSLPIKALVKVYLQLKSKCYFNLLIDKEKQNRSQKKIEIIKRASLI